MHEAGPLRGPAYLPSRQAGRPYSVEQAIGQGRGGLVDAARHRRSPPPRCRRYVPGTGHWSAFTSRRKPRHTGSPPRPAHLSHLSVPRPRAHDSCQAPGPLITTGTSRSAGPGPWSRSRSLGPCRALPCACGRGGRGHLYLYLEGAATPRDARHCRVVCIRDWRFATSGNRAGPCGKRTGPSRPCHQSPLKGAQKLLVRPH